VPTSPYSGGGSCSADKPPLSKSRQLDRPSARSSANASAISSRTSPRDRQPGHHQAYPSRQPHRRQSASARYRSGSTLWPARPMRDLRMSTQRMRIKRLLSHTSLDHHATTSRTTAGTLARAAQPRLLGHRMGLDRTYVRGGVLHDEAFRAKHHQSS